MGRRDGKSGSADPGNSSYANQFSSSGNAGTGEQKSSSNDADDKSGNSNAAKPAVGSDEWHRLRKDNHKEVERRRRETINDGINELAKIVPGCEKNKGSILQRAVQYIQQLKDNEATNIEKWTLEKLLTDQAINEYQMQVENLKQELEKVREELATVKGEDIKTDSRKRGAEDEKTDVKKARVE